MLLERGADIDKAKVSGAPFVHSLTGGPCGGSECATGAGS